jgi:hypothetical protein
MKNVLLLAPLDGCVLVAVGGYWFFSSRKHVGGASMAEDWHFAYGHVIKY